MSLQQAGGVRVGGQSLPHLAGARHTSGSAEYTDDAPLPPGGLHAALVTAQQAPATIESVDTAEAARLLHIHYSTVRGVQHFRRQ